MNRATALTLSIVLATALSGCSSDEESDSEPSWKPESSVPTEPGADGFTQPGAVLTTEDLATVPYLNDNFSDQPTVEGTLEISGIEEPVEADPDELTDDVPIEDGQTAYYVNFWVEVAGDHSLDGQLVHLTAFDTEGEGMHTWASSSFEPCSGTVPGLGAPGDEGPVCSVVIADDADIAAVGYEAAPAYDDNPVLWDLT